MNDSHPLGFKKVATHYFPNRDARSCDNLNGYYAKVSLPKLKTSHTNSGVPQQFQDSAVGFGAFATNYHNNPNPNYPFLRHHQQHNQLPPVHYLGTPPVNPR